MYKFGARPFPLCLNGFLYSVFVVYMSSICLADVQDFWILLWIVFFTVMITVCLEALNRHYNSWMLLFSYLWLIILADYFLSPISSYMFSFRCRWKWETTQKRKSINNKYFMCVTINKVANGNIVFVIPVRINYTRTSQNVRSKC